MLKSEWFEFVRRTLYELGVPPLDPTRFVPLSKLTLADFWFGLKLRTIKTATVVKLELDRRNRGEVLEPMEERVALTLSSEFDELEDFLLNLEFTGPEIERSKEKWLFIIVMQLRSQWPNSVWDFPHLQFGTLQNAWDSDDFLRKFLRSVKRVGFIYFGKSASHRFVARLDKALAAERTRLDLG